MIIFYIVYLAKDFGSFSFTLKHHEIMQYFILLGLYFYSLNNELYFYTIAKKDIEIEILS